MYEPDGSNLVDTQNNHVSAILCLPLISMSLLSSPLGPPPRALKSRPGRRAYPILGSQNSASCDQREAFSHEYALLLPLSI